MAELGFYVHIFEKVWYVHEHLFVYVVTQRKEFTGEKNSINCDIEHTVYQQELEVSSFREVKQVFFVPFYQNLTIDGALVGNLDVENTQVKQLEKR